MNSSDTDPLFELSEEIHGLESVLKEVVGMEPGSGLRLLYVCHREDEPQVASLVELLADQLPNYVIPLRKRRLANAASARSVSGGDMSRSARLVREARRLLVKYNEKNPGRYGEFGELIAYVVAQHFLVAPQLCSKIALKTNFSMPVHGVDGLHARIAADGTLTLYLLESKITPDPTDATRSFLDSAKKYQDDRSAQLNELRLVVDLSNLDELRGEARDRAKAYFDEYSDGAAVLSRREVHVGSLVFEEPSYEIRIPKDRSRSVSIHEDNFVSLYKEKYDRFVKNRDSQAAAVGFDLGGCILFMIAVPDVLKLKELFSEVTG